MQCTKCKRELFRSDFYANRHVCKSCMNKRRVASRFQITVERYQELLDAQNGICFLCPEPANDLDHDHKTGRIRKFLCKACNTIIGRIENRSTMNQYPQRFYDYTLIGETK